MRERSRFSFKLRLTNILLWTVKGGRKELAPKTSYNVTLIGRDKEMKRAQRSNFLSYGAQLQQRENYSPISNNCPPL